MCSTFHDHGRMLPEEINEPTRRAPGLEGLLYISKKRTGAAKVEPCGLSYAPNLNFPSRGVTSHTKIKAN